MSVNASSMPHKSAPTAARASDGLGYKRKRSSQSAAVPTVPGLASCRSADGTTNDGAACRPIT
jgi:hypothetical protein